MISEQIPLPLGTAHAAAEIERDYKVSGYDCAVSVAKDAGFIGFNPAHVIQVQQRLIEELTARLTENEQVHVRAYGCLPPTGESPST